MRSSPAPLESSYTAQLSHSLAAFSPARGRQSRRRQSDRCIAPAARPSVRPPRRARSDVSSGIRVAQLRGEWERGGLAMTSGWRLKEGGGERDRVRRGRWRRRQRRVGESQQLLPPLGIIALTQSCYFSEQLRFGSTGVKDGARGRRCRRRLRGTRSSPLPSPLRLRVI